MGGRSVLGDYKITAEFTSKIAEVDGEIGTRRRRGDHEEGGAVQDPIGCVTAQVFPSSYDFYSGKEMQNARKE